MALTRTRDEMREAIRRTADVYGPSYTDRTPDSFVDDLINRGLGMFVSLCATVTPKFVPVASTTINTDGVSTIYALPVNFRTLLSVEYTYDGNRTWLVPFEQHERASLLDPEVTSASARATGYMRVGSNIELLPRPPSGHSVLIWYATNAPQLNADSATIDTLDRLVDNYVIWWAAREIAGELGHWERHGTLSEKLAPLDQDIRLLARTRDLSAPARIVDLAYADRFGRMRGYR